jgi:hypothetical protein
MVKLKCTDCDLSCHNFCEKSKWNANSTTKDKCQGTRFSNFLDPLWDVAR